jgi:hypothetical protein
MPVDSAAGVASVAVTSTGVADALSILSPACAVTQIEQTWWEVVEFSACACTACTTPIVHTSAIASRHTTLTRKPEFADVLTIIVVRESRPDAC